MSLKVKLISIGALFILMLGVLVFDVFAATQQLTLKGSISFNIRDKSLYVKDVRIKQNLNSQPQSIDSFLPGYLNQDFDIDLTGIIETNTYGSFSLYFDIINTTENYWEIKNVSLPNNLISQGVKVSYSGMVETNDLTDTDNDGYKNFTNIETAPYDTLILTITAPNANEEAPLVLDGIVITIDEYVFPTVTTIATGKTEAGENLGIATSEGYALVGDEITLHADFAEIADSDFLGWKTSEEDTEYISTLPDYTFTFEETSPTTYYAVFTEPNAYLTYDSFSTTNSTARLRRCSAGAEEVIVPSAICRTTRTPSTYTITQMYSANTSDYSPFNPASLTLQSVSLPETITNIGSNAFYDCINLTSITISEGVTSIGSRAFDGCSGLISVTIPSTVTVVNSYAFADCSNLISVNFKENSQLTSIEQGAFYSCSSLINMIIPEGVTSIGAFIFSGCNSLTSVTIPASVRSIGIAILSNSSELQTIEYTGTIEEYLSIEFGSNWISDSSHDLIIDGEKVTEIVVPDSITSIGQYAFYGCDGLTSVTFSDSVESIDQWAFSYCSDLRNIYFGDNNQLASISSFAFYECERLLSADFGENSQLRSIGGYAFYNCDDLKNIVLSPNITSIGGFSFYYCSAIQTIEYTGTIEKYLSINFGAHWLIDSSHEFIVNGMSVKELIIPSSITSISQYAFYGCNGINSITIPNSVKSIGEEAFYGCSGIERLEYTGTLEEYLSIVLGSSWINDNSHEFIISGTVVNDLVIPESITSISQYAFYGCRGLISITIPNTVTSIGTYAFRSCSDLVNLIIPNSVTSIGSNAFAFCNGLTNVTIPSSITAIEGSVFYNCDNLATITIPSSVTSISGWAFLSCNNIDSIEFTGTLEEYLSIDFSSSWISDSSHRLIINGMELTELVIPSSITNISGWAFYGCSRLTSATIPSSITSIENYTFYGCSGLTSITIPEGVTNIGEYAFSGCSSLTSITIPTTVTNIGNCAFTNCSSLTSIIIPEGVTSIGGSTFSGCNSLTNITIPNSVTSIGSSAFNNCYSLTSIIIPSSVTSIGNSAFQNCYALAEIYNYSSSITVQLGNTSSSNNGYLGQYAKVVYNSSELATGTPESKIQVIDNVQYYVDGEDFIALAPAVNRNSLTTVALDSRTTEINQRAFYNCRNLTSITIPSNVKSIGSNAFQYCYALAEVYNYSNSFTVSSNTSNGYVGYYAKVIYNASDLETETPESKIQVIGDVQYYVDGEDFIAIAPAIARNSLTTLTLDSKTTRINQYAFINCNNLVSITIPSSVTRIDTEAFSGCSSIEIIEYTGTLEEYLSINFSSYWINDSYELKIGGEIVNELAIPSSITGINYYAFYYCSSLTGITIPSSVTNIGSSAFYYCTNLTSITIPSSVTSIGSSAFYNCNLATVYIDSSTIANGITSSSSYGYLTQNATTLYIKDTITATTPPNGWIVDSAGSDQVDGYVKYIEA